MREESDYDKLVSTRGTLYETMTALAAGIINPSVAHMRPAGLGREDRGAREDWSRKWSGVEAVYRPPLIEQHVNCCIPHIPEGIVYAVRTEHG